MPTPTKGPRLGSGPAHERLMLANLATSLFEHGRITTTVTKAKRVRPLAERLITFAKRGDLHARRQVLRVVRDKDVVHTLFAEIGPGFAQRTGGYTRIVKIGNRKGDNAPMAVIELVEGLTVAQEAVGEAERARGTRFASRRGSATDATDAVADAGSASDAVASFEGYSKTADADADAAEDAPSGREAAAADAETADAAEATDADAADATDADASADAETDKKD